MNDFSALQDLKPILDEVGGVDFELAKFPLSEPLLAPKQLRLLQAHWKALSKGQETLGDQVSNATLVLEEAMDPDYFDPNRPVSSTIEDLGAAHVELKKSFERVSEFFKDLAIASWNPPILSPDDVKTAATGE